MGECELGVDADGLFESTDGKVVARGIAQLLHTDGFQVSREQGRVVFGALAAVIVVGEMLRPRSPEQFCRPLHPGQRSMSLAVAWHCASWSAAGSAGSGRPRNR